MPNATRFSSDGHASFTPSRPQPAPFGPRFLLAVAAPAAVVLAGCVVAVFAGTVTSSTRGDVGNTMRCPNRI